MRFLEHFFSASALIFNAILPPRCLKCDTVIGHTDGLCASCFKTVHFLDVVSGTYCQTCCLPLPGANPLAPKNQDPFPHNICMHCKKHPFVALHTVRAAFMYDKSSRPLVLAFKHADRTDMARSFAAWMRRVAGPLLAEADLVVPVPLHPLRLGARRYNQAALLAQYLVYKDQKGAYSPLALRRVKNTSSQGYRGRVSRHANLEGAFRMDQQYRVNVSGGKILLVDDVMTTGATLDACAQALRNSNAFSVSALVLARAPLKT